MKSVVSLSEAISKVKSGDIVGISGFLGVGEPFELIEELVKQNQQDLTLVSVVTSHPGKEVGVGRLCENHQVKKYIAAHVGTSAAAQREYFEKKMEVEFTPMGTVVERLHAAGAGLGAVLTPTGVGTILEKDYEKVIVDVFEVISKKLIRIIQINKRRVDDTVFLTVNIEESIINVYDVVTALSALKNVEYVKNS